MQQVLQRLIKKIGEAPIDPVPSDNIYMEDLFEPSFYREILSRFPSKEACSPIIHPDAKLPDGTVTRWLLDLSENTLRRFRPEDRGFWQLMYKLFISDTLRQAILQKFQSTIRARFGTEWPEMVSVPIFYKDYPGYFINIHPDADFKIATFQFYFPADESQIHLGTSFHRKEYDATYLHKTNAFKPNSGYAFVRTDNSWHSVRQVGAQEAERNTLALTIYLKGKEYKSGDRYK